MDLGYFSVSLAVNDLDASRAFYEKLGFEVTGGDADENWLILRNGDAVIGLFHGMFDDNILTFNPGLTLDGSERSGFVDVREIQRRLQDSGVELTTTTDTDGEGPAHVALVDPDGNSILIDQFH